MRNRRGLSTVVGAVFFVIAATTVISYISYSMNTIDQFAESVIVKEAENINRGLEDITISQITIVGGEFNMTVVNTGSLPVHLTRLWVIDEDSVVSDQKANIDVRINPGNEKYNIGQGTGISADSTKSYTLKVVTGRGNLATFQVSTTVSTQIALVTPGNSELDKNIRITAYITNNSTKPNNIANLIPELIMNVTLTKINGPIPSSIPTLPQGNTAIFTWTYKAPSTEQGVSFNASYTGAPSGTFVFANTTITKAGEAEKAGSSKWAESATRVGILISGIPNPMADDSLVYGKWGIGIINPLDRVVKVYAVGVQSATQDALAGSVQQAEPTTGWRLNSQRDQSLIIWEGGNSPIEIAANSVGQFRAEIEGKTISGGEVMIIIQALTSEGKLSQIYSVSVDENFPMMNVFYTSYVSDPLNNWGYLMKTMQSGTNDQLYNVTVQNASDSEILTSPVILVILIPTDFTDVQDVGGAGWNAATMAENPDGSKILTVQTTANTFSSSTHLTYQFSADNPVVSKVKLYVFQTTAVYPNWRLGDKIELSSALSEAGVQVNP